MNSQLRPVLLLLLLVVVLLVLMRKRTEPWHSLGCSSAVAELCGSTPARLVKTGASERHSGRRGLFITEA